MSYEMSDFIQTAITSNILTKKQTVTKKTTKKNVEVLAVWMKSGRFDTPMFGSTTT